MLPEYLAVFNLPKTGNDFLITIPVRRYTISFPEPAILGKEREALG
jgi:hypothetical protein